MPDPGERTRRYRERAAALRQLAERTNIPENRTNIIALAASFERLADAVHDGLQTADAGHGEQADLPDDTA